MPLEVVLLTLAITADGCRPRDARALIGRRSQCHASDRPLRAAPTIEASPSTRQICVVENTDAMVRLGGGHALPAGLWELPLRLGADPIWRTAHFALRRRTGCAANHDEFASRLTEIEQRTVADRWC
jgi:hypothetical protein